MDLGRERLEVLLEPLPETSTGTATSPSRTGPAAGTTAVAAELEAVPG